MKDLTVVTSVSGGYGQYLRDWAASLLRQTERPGAVAIFAHGHPEDCRAAEQAVTALRAGGLAARAEVCSALLPLGTARNRAVALARSPWVMHLDADDELLPHAVADIRALALTDRADIIALGYERSGDLLAGPRNRTKLYRPCPDGAAILRSPAPCSGVSPFRRALWERSPYRADLFGGWDTALWLGFGHLGARILPTTRPAFRYRQHADSIFNTRRRGGFIAHLTGLALEGLRQGWAGVSVILPVGDGGAEARDALRRAVEAHLSREVPDWEIVPGRAPAGDWRKGVAVMDGIGRARGATLLILDADCLLPGAALREAVDRVLGGARWAIPHRLVHRLNREATEDLLRGPLPVPLARLPGLPLARAPYEGFAGGGCFAIPRWSYLATGGIPVSFVGWGAEDEAAAAIFDALLGPHVRGEADLWHLWHPPAPRRATEDGGRARQNRQRLAHVRRLAHRPDLLWAALRGAPSFAMAPGTRYWDHERHTTLARAQERRREELATMTRNRFADRRFAAIHARQQEEDQMAGALDVKHAHRLTRLAQQRRNEEARQAAEAARLAAALAVGPRALKGDLLSAEHKALLTQPVPGTVAAFGPEPQGPPFASARAAALAAEAGLLAEHFGDESPAGAAGYTVAQVRAVIARVRGA